MQTASFEDGDRCTKNRTCETCRYWSEMVAQSIGCGPIEALCLAPDGPYHGMLKRADRTCASWAVNSHGAWDEPPDYGETARRKYEEECAAYAEETAAMGEHAGKTSDFLP